MRMLRCLLLLFACLSSIFVHSQEQPQDDTVYKIGNGVKPPHAIYSPNPGYSEEARKARWKGTVLLQTVIDTEGRATNIKVTRALGKGLDEKAVEAVSKWKFTPAMKDGRPVRSQIMIEVNFRLY